MQKFIKRVVIVSKASAKNIIKNLRKLKSFVKRFEKSCLKLLTVVEGSIQEMIWFVNFSLVFEAKFQCGRIIYWFFDKWVGFCQIMLWGYFEVSGRSSWFCFYLWNDWGCPRNICTFGLNDHVLFVL